MENASLLNSVNSFEVFIAKCYIFFLPLRMIPLLFGVLSPFGAQAEYFDFIILIFGIMAYFFLHRFHPNDRPKSRDKVLWSFAEALAVFIVLSLIMTWYVFIRYGNFRGNSPFVASGKMLLNFVQYFAMLCYGKYILSILSPTAVLKVLHTSILFLLGIGLIQLGTRYGLVPGALYDMLANILYLAPRRGEIALTTLERSHAAMLIGIIVLPYYFSKILNSQKLSGLQIAELLLWFILGFSGESSTMYLILGAETAVMLIWMVFKHNTGIWIKIGTIFLSFLMVLVLMYPEIIDNIFGVDFTYLLFDKATDSENQSSASRYLVLYANVLIFMKFPVFGCGNGLQGYFYRDFSYILEGKTVLETTKQLYTGTLDHIANGSTFFAGVLSGWGLIGSSAFLRFVVKSFRTLIAKKKEYPIFFYYYCIALVGIMISGIKSEFVGIPYIWFVLCLPCAAYYSHAQNRRLNNEND